MDPGRHRWVVEVMECTLHEILLAFLLHLHIRSEVKELPLAPSRTNEKARCPRYRAPCMVVPKRSYDTEIMPVCVTPHGIE